MNASPAPLVLMHCRICLGEFEDGVMTSLLEGVEDTLNDKIEFCCGIKIRQSAKLPTKVCSSCCEFVGMWINFRQMCLNSQVYWESSCPERPEEMCNASDSEYMEYLFEKLQLNPANNYLEEDPQITELVEEELEDLTSQSLKVLDVNDFVISEQVNQDEEAKSKNFEVLVSQLDLEENMELKSQNADDNSLLTEEYYEVDCEEEIHDEDFLSESPSPELKGTLKMKRGRPRKPDNELKCKRKIKKGRGKTNLDSEQFMCGLCGKIYLKKSVFTAHMMAHTDYKPHQCEICIKSFRQMGELRAHMRRHTGERPYKCMYCDRHFYDRSERVRHERVHTNTRPYACDECGKTFTHTAILKNHILTHSAEKNYNCAICSKSFTLQHQLKAHLQTLTHRSKEEMTVANYIQS
ncbi:hypothetical protein KR009_002039 [Drosophila setifemur]|nr:hypothetical protein KR009_002039 [Drosophila setifemur]